MKRAVRRAPRPDSGVRDDIRIGGQPDSFVSRIRYRAACG